MTHWQRLVGMRVKRKEKLRATTTEPPNHLHHLHHSPPCHPVTELVLRVRHHRAPQHPLAGPCQPRLRALLVEPQLNLQSNATCHVGDYQHGTWVCLNMARAIVSACLHNQYRTLADRTSFARTNKSAAVHALWRARAPGRGSCATKAPGSWLVRRNKKRKTATHTEQARR
jgi:hypothetical protein